MHDGPIHLQNSLLHTLACIQTAGKDRQYKPLEHIDQNMSTNFQKQSTINTSEMIEERQANKEIEQTKEPVSYHPALMHATVVLETKPLWDKVASFFQ